MQYGDQVPKDYERFEDDVLKEMMRTFDFEALRTASGEDTMKRVTFYGHEKNETTAKLAQVNLAVHGLEGRIRAGNEAITCYVAREEEDEDCDFEEAAELAARIARNFEELGV